MIKLTDQDIRDILVKLVQLEVLASPEQMGAGDDFLVGRFCAVVNHGSFIEKVRALADNSRENLCDSHYWAGQGECPECQHEDKAFDGLTDSVPTYQDGVNACIAIVQKEIDGADKALACNLAESFAREARAWRSGVFHSKQNMEKLLKSGETIVSNTEDKKRKMSIIQTEVRNDAEEKRLSAGYGGGRDDGGARGIENALTAWLDGVRFGETGETIFYQGTLQKYNDKEKADKAEYLRLKAIYGDSE